MALVFSLLSFTVDKILQFSGLVDDRNVHRTKKMEEKALEVYGRFVMTLKTPENISLLVSNTTVPDVIRSIRDPEKPNTLEELEVVTEKCVEVQELQEDEFLIIIKFSPTVPHCSLATLIG